MMWFEEYQGLSDRDKEQFTRLINALLANTFLLRERVDPKDKSIIIDRDYRFLERYFSIFKGYLAIAGWDLTLDTYLGVAALSNISGTNRYKLNKLETFFLLVLRLIYHEESEKLTLRKDVVTTVRDLLEKMSLLNLLEKKIPDKALSEGLTALKEFNLIDRIGGEWKEQETKIVIYPSILLAVTEEQIHYLYERRQHWKNPQVGVFEFNETAS